MWQANHIAALLRGQGHTVEIEIIKTTGDRLQEVTFAQVGSKGMFTKEIEEALAEGRVDLAVHSLKDLPTELPELFALAATPPRVDPRDVFVSVKYESLADLPRGAKVGTSSQRRKAQLKALRPDIEAIEFRGNVDTRLRKLMEGQVDAILLAAAGLDRLEKTEWVRERLEPKEFCPAAGQGSLGIETRKDDASTIAAVAFLDDTNTRFAVSVERAALAALGGGCQVPIGVYVRPCPAPGGESIKNERWVEIHAVVADPESGNAARIFKRVLEDHNKASVIGGWIAQKLIEAGAGPLLRIHRAAFGRSLGVKEPLAGRRVLVTRSAQQSGKLSEGLRALGAEAVEVPVIEISPPASYEALDAALRRLDHYDWLLLTSTNAVLPFHVRAMELGVSLSNLKLQIAAIGKATAQALEIVVHLKVALTPTEYVAESLVAALKEQIAGKRVLLVRADVARDVVPDGLRSAGATVDVVDAYRNAMPAAAPAQLCKALAEGLDAATFTSSSSVTHLAGAATVAGVSFPLKGVLAISIGPITSQTLRECGWAPAAEAEPHDIPGLIAAVRGLFS